MAQDGCAAAEPEAPPCDGCRPIAVTVEQRRMGRGLTAFVVASVCIALLCFVGCTAAVTGAVGGLAALAGGGVGSRYSYGEGPRIAAFHMDQAISSTSGISPETVRQAVRRVEADPSVVALVVRCDCGGGGAAASEEIATYFASCTKPVVFSVGSLCASGAYMAAAQSDWIVAGPMSSVGSIGTIVTAYDLQGLYENLGIAVEVVKSADSKDMGATYRSLTDEERAMLQDQVERINGLFVASVAEGRGVSEETVEKWADGTAYLGIDALEMGMVDELGTYDDALEKAARLAGVDYGECVLLDMGPVSSELGAILGV